MANYILAINDGYDASAAVFYEGKLISAIFEEKLNGQKSYKGFPSLAVEQVLIDSDITFKDINTVVASHLNTTQFIKRKLTDKDFYNPKYLFANIIDIFDAFKKETRIRTLVYSNEIKRFEFCEHHYAHALAAYYSSGLLDDVLVFTMDELGDALSHTVYTVKEGIFTKTADGDRTASLGMFYTAVTEGLGFAPYTGEERVMYLSLKGNPDNAYEAISKLVTLKDNSKSFKVKSRSVIIKLVSQLLKKGVLQEDIAAAAQKILEDTVVTHINSLIEETKISKIACAGGLFKNVRLNQSILENTSATNIFIHPVPGNEGLVLGASFSTYFKEPPEEPKQYSDLYFGSGIPSENIYNQAGKLGYIARDMDDPVIEVAELIAKGSVIGWCDGRTEFSSRGLGHRSIIADPRNTERLSTLREKINIPDVIPFETVVLFEKKEQVCDFKKDYKEMQPGQFKTYTFDTLDEWLEKTPMVVGGKSVMLPQFVDGGLNEPLHDILIAFDQITKIPFLVCMSLNIYSEPMAVTVEKVFEMLEQGIIDTAIFENKIIVSKS